MRETQARSLIKTIAWRIVASLVTWAVIFAYTGQAGESTKYAFAIAVINFAMYYAHERIWNLIPWGKYEKI